ncbi:hypothetical protein Pint_08548 [Pistacia integerrima]|uniref:Uncharacterized protein n=1 Tax=Pistacia integerrima TaxID=434235 RepID=A0ACC0XXU9_9ROSI|nr:hypothetical protein Pint_08548 [Pistacia integerrima]
MGCSLAWKEEIWIPESRFAVQGSQDCCYQRYQPWKHLGLEIEQCVISCFNDFSVQASCSEETEQRTLISSEDIKQALFRNAGYGGRCL